MDTTKVYRIGLIIACVTILHIIINLFICWKYSSFDSFKHRSSCRLIESGVVTNSFNPPRIALLFSSNMTRFNHLSIIDNNVILIQLSNVSDPSPTTMLLPDGFHQLDILIIDELKHIEFYQQVNLATGSQSLLVTVLDEQYRPAENISVHLELFDYPYVTIEHSTNRFGEVIFYYLPQHMQVYIEAICTTSKRYAFMKIDTLHYRNITLILKETRSFHYDEYDSMD